MNEQDVVVVKRDDLRAVLDALAYFAHYYAAEYNGPISTDRESIDWGRNEDTFDMAIYDRLRMIVGEPDDGA